MSRRSRLGGVLLVTILVIGAGSGAAAADYLGEDDGGNVVRFEGDRLTLDVSDMSLRSLLLEVAQQSGARVQMDGVPDRSVSEAFTRLPIDEALRRLLGEQSFTLVYAERSRAGGGGAGLHLKELRVYGGEGPRLDTASRAKGASKVSRSSRPTAAGPAPASAADTNKPAAARNRTRPSKRSRDAATEDDTDASEGAADAQDESTEHGEEAEASEADQVEYHEEPVETELSTATGVRGVDPRYLSGMAGEAPLNPVAASVLANQLPDEDEAEWEGDADEESTDELDQMHDMQEPAYDDYQDHDEGMFD